MLKNRKEVQEYLEKVDAVCMECADGSDEKCTNCPVRKTVKMLNNEEVNNNKTKEKIYCKHCGDELIVGKNHEKHGSCEPNICDHCMGKYYYYCDECHNLFVYYDKMNKHFHHKKGNLCPTCRTKFQKPTTKTLLVTVQCMATYDSAIEVPANLTIDEAIEYAKEHIDEISLGELEYVQESDQLDEDNCCFDDETEPKFAIGMAVTFTTNQSDLMQFNGQGVTIRRILSEDECDIDDVGYMYEVLTFNGNQFQAFEDELF